MSSPLRRRRRGMTMLEVMVSIAILLVMSAIVVESLRNSIEVNNLLGDRDATVRTARVALAKIKRDLKLAYLSPNRMVPDRYLTLFVGLDEEPDKLYFASLNHQRLYLNSREADQTEITIWAEQAPEDKGHGYVLYHREAPRIDEEPDEDGVVWPLAYNVRSFRLRYLDQLSEEWRDEWDTRSADTPYRLPRAVEIGLVLIAPDPEDPEAERTVDVPFLTTVVLEYAERMPNPNDPTRALGGFGGGQGGYGGGGFNGLGAGAPGMPNPFGLPGNTGAGRSSGNSRGGGSRGRPNNPLPGGGQIPGLGGAGGRR